MDSEQEKKAWRKVGHKERFINTFRGLYVFWMTTNSLFRYITPPAILIVIIFGFYFNVSKVEWVALVLTIGFVIISEMFNTAIEIDIDLTSPQYHPYARDTKDVAAGAVLLSIFISIIVGLIIFLPKILLYVSM
ncbi:diacylglycerol kinase family protein [Patescibacteria group bacterium]|nr:diacylglycerol kinase family protein [Patescibacteria group bacterium]